MVLIFLWVNKFYPHFGSHAYNEEYFRNKKKKPLIFFFLQMQWDLTEALPTSGKEGKTSIVK